MIKKLLNSSFRLSNNYRKILLRDVRNDLTSVWIFYIHLRPTNKTLVLADSFTTLPISLAHHSQQVIVYGMQEPDLNLLNTLANTSGIDNYEILHELQPPTQKFDLVVDASFGRLAQEIFPDQKTIDQYIHQKTQLWILTKNKYSLANLKNNCLSSILSFSPFKPQNGCTTRGITSGRNSSLPSCFNSSETNSYLKKIAFSPFMQLGLLPEFHQIKAARPFAPVPTLNLMRDFFSRRQKLRVEDIFVAASKTPHNSTWIDGFLTFLSHPRNDYINLEQYHVSPSGKVYLFTSLDSAKAKCKTVIKLPIAKHTQPRLLSSYQALSFFANSGRLTSQQKRLFPQPIQKGFFQNQSYFMETVLQGRPGDTLQLSENDLQNIVRNTFGEWINIQRALTRRIVFDSTTFDRLIEKPVRAALNFVENDDVDLQNSIISYLKKYFLGQKYALSVIHGDFSLKNVLFDNHKLRPNGFIDFDMLRFPTFPVLDAFHFFRRLDPLSYQQSAIQSLLTLIRERNANKIFNSVLELYEQAFNIGHLLHEPLAILYWTYRVSARFGSLKSLDRMFVLRNYHEPINAFAKMVSV